MRYRPAQVANLALRALEAQQGEGARALLVTGAPGVGKTALAEHLAATRRAHYVYALLHAWSGSDDLFSSVDVRAAVAGDADHVHQPGVLALAAEASHRHDAVVVCLDEIDKAPEATEALLLDWLQSGRVPVRPGVHLYTRLDRVLVVLTSNATRPHSDALIRRCRRLRMPALAPETAIEIAAERSDAPAGLVRLLYRAASVIAQADGIVVTVQELAHCARECAVVAASVHDVAEALRSWIARDEPGVEAVDGDAVRRLLPAIWAEIVRGRRAGEVAHG